MMDPTPIEERFPAMIESLGRNEAIDFDGDLMEPEPRIEDGLKAFALLKDETGVELDPAMAGHRIRYGELGAHWFEREASTGAGGGVRPARARAEHHVRAAERRRRPP